MFVSNRSIRNIKNPKKKFLSKIRKNERGNTLLTFFTNFFFFFKISTQLVLHSICIVRSITLARSISLLYVSLPKSYIASICKHQASSRPHCATCILLARQAKRKKKIWMKLFLNKHEWNPTFALVIFCSFAFNLRRRYLMILGCVYATHPSPMPIASNGSQRKVFAARLGKFPRKIGASFANDRAYVPKKRCVCVLPVVCVV